MRKILAALALALLLLALLWQQDPNNHWGGANEPQLEETEDDDVLPPNPNARRPAPLPRLNRGGQARNTKRIVVEFGCRIKNEGRELCNGIDDDCDDITDEFALGTGRALKCSTDAGAEGYYSCVDGTVTCVEQDYAKAACAEGVQMDDDGNCRRSRFGHACNIRWGATATGYVNQFDDDGRLSCRLYNSNNAVVVTKWTKSGEPLEAEFRKDSPDCDVNGGTTLGQWYYHYRDDGLLHEIVHMKNGQEHTIKRFEYDGNGQLVKTVRHKKGKWNRAFLVHTDDAGNLVAERRVNQDGSLHGQVRTHSYAGCGAFGD